MAAVLDPMHWPLAEKLPFAWRYPRWNVSRHAATFRAADAFVVSIQKSGRTWVRVFLTAYFSEWGKGNFPPEARPAAASAMPTLCYSHDLWEHKAKEQFGERLRGKWLIPREETLNKPILLVARDPRDVMVSLFFHLKKRAGTFEGDLPALLRHPVFGIKRVVEISSFENMRRLEAGVEGAKGSERGTDLNKEALRPKNADDPDSYKVRRGKVGGYTDYLGAADVEYMNTVLATLDPRYGYGVGR